MKSMKFIIKISLILSAIFACLTITGNIISADDPKGNDLLGLTPAQIVRLRGFVAKDLYFTTSDGYIINIVWCYNPIFGNTTDCSKDPVVFFHGVLSDSKSFIVDSVNARPKDYSSVNTTNLTDAQLYQLVKNDPSANALPFLLMNFKHQVFLVNRRGTMYSQGHTVAPSQQQALLSNGTSTTTTTGSGGKKKEKKRNRKGSQMKVIEEAGDMQTQIATAINNTLPLFADPASLAKQFNPKYWNYTCDTEAAIDLPQIVTFITQFTGCAKISYVGHSLGAGLPLMSMVVNDTLQTKLHKACLLAPGVDFGATNPDKNSFFKELSLAFREPLELYSGPVPPTQLDPLLTNSIVPFCNIANFNATLCAEAVSFIFGDGGEQLNLQPGFLSLAPDTIASHQLAQLVQAVTRAGSNFYDYATSGSNQVAYKSSIAPLYDFGKIVFEGLAIFYGETDTFVQYQCVQQLLSELKVPVQVRYYDDPGLKFDHLAFLIHQRIAELLNVPCLRIIESE